MNLTAWLLAMVGPLLTRTLATLGMSLVTLAGVTVAFDALKSRLIANIGGMPAEGVQLAGLFGIWEALGIILGGWLFVITWQTTKGMWSVVKT